MLMLPTLRNRVPGRGKNCNPRCLLRSSSEKEPPSVVVRPEAAAAATVAAEAAGAPADHPRILNPVEAFPMDTELRREIGAAVDTEMHRKLGATVAAATAAPGAALHPDVAAVHERVVAEEETAAAAAVSGVPMVNFDDTAVSYASFSNVELLRFVMCCCLLLAGVLNRSASCSKVDDARCVVSKYYVLISRMISGAAAVHSAMYPSRFHNQPRGACVCTCVRVFAACVQGIHGAASMRDQASGREQRDASQDRVSRWDHCSGFDRAT